ncbi:MAG: hypothetical protein Phog2KO_16930 [Phototrophicaceae bacterium]
MSEPLEPKPPSFDDIAPDDTQPNPNDDISDLKSVEDLTLSELMSTFFKRPKDTASAFSDVVQSDRVSPSSRLLSVETTSTDDSMTWVERQRAEAGSLPRAILNKSLKLFTSNRIFGYSIAFVFVLIGHMIMSAGVDVRRTEDLQLAQGLPYVVFGFCLWLATELVFSLPDIRAWWIARGTNISTFNDRPQVRDIYDDIPLYMRIPVSRWVLAFIAMSLSGITWLGTSENTFETPTFYIWLLSVASWAFVLAPLDFNIFEWATAFIDRLRAFRLRKYVGVILALVIILSSATYFRFHRLAEHPLEMTDDHVEKILDSGRVRDGARNIFFANNGGREPMQMYLIALASYLPNLGINHDTIKFVSSVESLLTIPALFWMGYALLEGETKRRRLLVALILSALVAVSYWHVAITRQGLRIPLTPLVVSLHLIYLLRGIRHNRRGDFIIAGLILGFGLYTYQAVRMLPIVIVVVVGLAIVFKAKTLKERLNYVLNLSVLVAISFSAFLPMFHYSVDYPELFWRRTTGRLLGDDVIQETLANGTVIYRDATVQERADAFLSNVPTIASNIRNVLMMFNWEGDVATISGVSTRPAMDALSATLLILGVGAWFVFAIRRRQLVYWLVPLIAFLMLLPSALSIAFPHENPSHTRTSGAIPMIYLMASFPLALFMEQILDESNNLRGKFVSGIVCVAIIVGSFNYNTYLYFDVYPERYEESFHPYSDAGQYLYGYVLTGGAYGNAFLIGYEHWWSHRAIGLEGGLEEFWTGGIYPYVDGNYSTEPIIQAIYSGLETYGTFEFRPTADLLFFFSPNDDATADALQALFPSGLASERQTYNPNETFMVYEVPALGTDGLQTWIADHPQPQP